MAKLKVIKEKNDVSKETDKDLSDILDEINSFNEEKPSRRNRRTEMQLLFRIGTILTNGAGK